MPSALRCGWSMQPQPFPQPSPAFATMGLQILKTKKKKGAKPGKKPGKFRERKAKKAKQFVVRRHALRPCLLLTFFGRTFSGVPSVYSMYHLEKSDFVLYIRYVVWYMWLITIDIN